jgi:hypothetical protein
MQYQFKLEDAETIKQTYSSWIGKPAHVGNGESDILKKITIVPKNVVSLARKNYFVKFEFSHAKLHAIEFLKNNGLNLSI